MVDANHFTYTQTHNTYVSFALLSRRSRHKSGLVHRCCPSVCLFVCLSVCLSVAKMKKRYFFKTKQFRAMFAIDDLQKVVHGLFKEPIIGSLKSMMAEILLPSERLAIKGP